MAVTHTQLPGQRQIYPQLGTYIRSRYDRRLHELLSEMRAKDRKLAQQLQELVINPQTGDQAQSTEHPYDLVFSFPGKPAANTTYPWIQFTRDISFLGNFATSVGSVGTVPTAQATFTLKKNGVTCGTIVVATTGAVTFTTTGGTAVEFLGGNYLDILSPSSQDATLANLRFTLSGTRLQ